MPERVRIKKKAAEQNSEAPTEEPQPVDTKSREEHLADVDAILDDIDELLESEAQEFVASYVQKGGE